VRVIYGDPQIGDRYGNQALPPIHIIVKNGQLRLEGVVANQGDKNLINVRANGIANVFKVTNVQALGSSSLRARTCLVTSLHTAITRSTLPSSSRNG
jgi:hypothetical protein